MKSLDKQQRAQIIAARAQFPILNQTVYGKPLVYFDNGATTQKPIAVIEAVDNYYKAYNSNVHRGVHYLSQTATTAMEAARSKIANWIGAASEEIIFTKGTTDSINLVAFSYGETFINEGDEIIITQMEHHSNIVPWQMMCKRKKAKLKYIPLLEDGTLDLTQLPNLITAKTKLIAMTWVSNTLGTVNPIQDIIQLAKQKNIHVLIDAAQGIQHIPFKLTEYPADFVVASGHKMYAGTGIGFLYGKKELLSIMEPYQGGGAMIKEVKMECSTYTDLPFRFEAGTPHMAGAVSLGAAVDFLENLGMEAIYAYEHELMQYAEEALSKIQRVNILGTPALRTGAISLTFEGAHPFDVGELLDKQGIAVRTGHHCCQPIMDFYDVSNTLRLSFGIYNNTAEIDLFVKALERSLSML